MEILSQNILYSNMEHSVTVPYLAVRCSFEKVLEETFGGAFVDVVGVACIFQRALEVTDGHWISTSECDVGQVDLEVLLFAAESLCRFSVTLWLSIVQAVVRIVEHFFEEVVDGTKRLAFVFLLEG